MSLKHVNRILCRIFHDAGSLYYVQRWMARLPISGTVDISGRDPLNLLSLRFPGGALENHEYLSQKSHHTGRNLKRRRTALRMQQHQSTRWLVDFILVRCIK
jgi:hypothetical protein